MAAYDVYLVPRKNIVVTVSPQGNKFWGEVALNIPNSETLLSQKLHRILGYVPVYQGLVMTPEVDGMRQPYKGFWYRVTEDDISALMDGLELDEGVWERIKRTWKMIFS